MSENIRVENWCGYNIRFVEHEGSWYAVLKDICDALKLRTCDVKLRIECEHLAKLAVECVRERPEVYKNYDPDANGLVKSLCDYEMLCVDEAGIYQALSRSTRLKARKFIDNQYITNVDYRKVITYGVLGGVGAVAVCIGVAYIAKRVKAKKADKKEG